MARASALHRHTPALTVHDARDRVLRQVAYCRATSEQTAARRVSLSRHDVAGQVHRQWDPRGFERPDAAPVQHRLTSLSGRPLLDESADAGWQLTLPGDAGQAAQSWDTRGSHWHTRFDERLRPSQVEEGSTGQPSRVSTSFTYANATGRNCRGRLVRQDDEAGSRLIDSYDLNGQIRSETRHFLATLDLPDWPDAVLEPGDGASTRFVHGPLQEVLAQTDALGNQRCLRFNLGGELKTLALRLQDGTEHPLLTDARYNPFGQVESQIAGNGTVSRCEYDPATGRLSRLSASRPGRSILQDLQYDYDPVGNVLKIEDHSQPVTHFANQRVDPVNTFRYDSLYQLIEATGREALGALIGPQLPELAPDPGDTSNLLNYRQEYEYDASGNLLSLKHVGQQPYTRSMNVADHSNRAVPAPGDPLTAFDPNGNLLDLDAGQPLQWNARNQLHSTRQVARPDGEDDQEHYRYGGDGLRVRKVCTRLVAGRMRLNETRYLPGLELHARQGESFSVITTQAGRCAVRCLVWGEGPPGGIANPQMRYSLDDLHDSSGLELDDAANIISHEGYYPFGGTAWWAANSAIEASYKARRYSGKERDSTGFYYYGLRYYAPWLMRWISPDPAGDIDGLNRYRFVGNNPATQRDDQGLMNTSKQPEHPGKAERLAFIAEHFTHEWPLADDMEEDPGIPLPSRYELDSRYEPKKGEVNTFLNKFKPRKWTFKFIQKETRTNQFFASDVTFVQAKMVAERFGFVGERPSEIKYKSVINYETLEALSGLENGSEEMKTAFLTGTPTGKSAAQIIKELDMTALTVTLKDQDWGEDNPNELLEASILIQLEAKASPSVTMAPATVMEVAPRSPRSPVAARVVSRRHSR
ncbi:RHS repeat domain-containing protein [Pseudomonas wadenswilerensis]